MKFAHLLAGTLTGLSACSAQAEILTFRGTSSIEMISTSFDGGDQFPFAGVTDADLITFEYYLDTDVMASSFIDGYALYEFSDSDSYMALGGNTFYYDSYSLAIGVDSLGFGFMTIRGMNSALGVSSSISLGSRTAFTTDIPISFDFDLIDFRNWMDVNSDQNSLTLPIVFGAVRSAELVPSPSSISALLLGATLTARRRR